MTRGEAILCLKGMKNYARDTFTEQADWQDSLDMAIEALEAEPKHGRWEMYGAITRGTLAIPIYRCSECKEDTNNWFWHYCPNCGAQMDLDEVEND